MLGSGADVGFDVHAIIEGELLRKIAGDELLAAGDDAAIGFFGIGEDAQEAGFSGTVAADKADFFTFAHSHGGSVKDIVTAKAEGEIFDGNNRGGHWGGKYEG